MANPLLNPKTKIQNAKWLVALAMAVASPAQGRQHCGQVTQNETWAAADSPHVVTCDVTVRRSVVTVEAGAQVLMREGTDLLIQADSGLVAEGREDGVIRFLPVARDDPPGFWGQIRFEPGSAGGRLDWVTLSAGGRDGVPMVEVRGEPVTMNHMRFQRAQALPLAMVADVLGPSLDEPGQLGSVAGAACAAMSLADNGVNAIQAIAAAEVDITQSQTWSHFCVPYRIGETLTIAGPESPTLAIGAGVRLQLDGDAAIVAGLDEARTGQVEANGSAAAPITLTAENGQPGGWAGIDLTPYSDGSSFLNTRIELGGRGGRPMVTVRGPAFAGPGTRLAGALGYPLAVRADRLSDFVTGLAAETEPVVLENGRQRILLLADEVSPDVPASADWISLGVPYDVQGDLGVAGRAGRTAFLTLGPGVELVFDGQERLAIGDPGGGSGGLRARGSAARPVVLTGAAATPGAWAGLTIAADSPEVSLDRVVLEHGGAGGGPMLDLGGAAGGGITATTFRGAAGYPVAVDLPSLDLLLGDTQAGQQNVYEANGANRILVRSAQAFSQRSSTWADPGVPLELDGSVTLTRPGSAQLTLQGGLRLLFPPGATFRLGLDTASRGAVTVQGGADAPVTLAARDGDAGWTGVRVSPGSSIQGTGLTVADVAADGVALQVQGGTVELAELTLAGRHRGVGLELAGVAARAEVTGSHILDHRIGVRVGSGQLVLARSVVSGNSEWGVLNAYPAQCAVAYLVYWGDPQGPNDPSDANDGCLNGAHAGPGDRVSDDVDWWPYALDPVTFPPAPISQHPNRPRVYLPLGLRLLGLGP
jgi:hypothetical protein